MSGDRVPGSPLSRLLIDISMRRDSGRIAIGPREVRLSGGRIVDILPAYEDESVEQFLVKAGRLSPEDATIARSQASVTDQPIEQILRTLNLSAEAIDTARRSLLLDRLVRAFATEAEGVSVSPLVPMEEQSTSEFSYRTLPLVLDALSRQAGEGAAGDVGARSGHYLIWEDHPLIQEAQTWCELLQEDAHRPIAHLLGQSPANASRIAALVQAGFARLVTASERPPISAIVPPPRSPFTHTLRPRVSSLPPMMPPLWRLRPGSAPPLSALHEDANEPLPRLSSLELPSFPDYVTPLNDPLDEYEKDIADLERSAAPRSERARAWRTFAQVWQRDHGSLSEAARAYREAAAADPKDFAALAQAATLCAATGSMDLAGAYADAALASCDENDLRAAEAWEQIAILALRVRDTGRARTALLEALRVHPSRPSSWIQLAFLHQAARDLPAAAEALTAAAGHLRSTAPARSRALLLDAYRLNPDAQAAAVTYAESLHSDGYGLAGVEWLERTARDHSSVDVQRALRTEAATLAESIERPDLAAQCLFDLFVAEPHLDFVYEPLLTDLANAGMTLDHAVGCETFAVECTPNHQADWLIRAAISYASIPGAEDWATELYVRALIRDPDREDALKSLRALLSSSNDPVPLADALERIIRASGAKRESQAELLRELATLTEASPGMEARAQWAWSQLADFGDSIAQQKTREFREPSLELARQAERELAQTQGEARLPLTRQVAVILAEHPDERKRAIELYREVLDHAHDPSAASTLERLILLSGQDELLPEHLKYRVRHASNNGERLRCLLWLGRVTMLTSPRRLVARVCGQIVALAPQSPEAAVRFFWAARDGTRAQRRQAIEARGRIADPAGTALVRLAHLDEEEGHIQSAVGRAREALVLDPRSAAATALLCRHLNHLPGADARSVVDHARALLGDSQDLLDRARAAATAANDRSWLEELLDVESRLAPQEPAVIKRRVDHLVRGSDRTLLTAVAEQAIDASLLDPEVAKSVERSIARMVELQAVDAASSLAMRALDRLGDAHWLSVAIQVSKDSTRHSTRLSVLERRIAWSRGTQRLAALRSLAALHRAESNRAAEARTWLRVLVDAAYDPEALDRLTTLYAETGEHERLLAVLALRLEAAQTPQERRQAALAIAAATAQFGGDPARMEEFLLSVDQNGTTTGQDTVADAADALVVMGFTDRAIDLLLAHAATHPQSAQSLCERALWIAEQVPGGTERSVQVAARGLEIVPTSSALLVAFERLALDSDASSLALRVYDQLAGSALGRHTRRGIRYREARWFERAGQLSPALNAYLNSFLCAPGDGVLFQGVERLSQETSNYEPLVEALTALVHVTRSAEQKLDYVRRAADTCERELADPTRALHILHEAWIRAGHWELAEQIRSLTQRLAAHDEDSAARGRDMLKEGLRSRADAAWDDRDRIRSLHLMASIYAEDENNLEEASAAIQAAIDPPPDEDELETLALARAAAESLAGWLQAAGRTDEAH